MSTTKSSVPNCNVLRHDDLRLQACCRLGESAAMDMDSAQMSRKPWDYGGSLQERPLCRTCRKIWIGIPGDLFWSRAAIFMAPETYYVYGSKTPLDIVQTSTRSENLECCTVDSKWQCVPCASPTLLHILPCSYAWIDPNMKGNVSSRS